MQTPSFDVRQSHAEPNAASAASQYLTFIMNNEEYGVDILCVQEIRGWETATPLPNAPKHIKGVINLRGTIVPIIDLRQCFGLSAIDYTAITVVIVLKVQAEAGSRVIGIVVDGVSDVYALADSDLHRPPDLGHAVDTAFIKGLASIDNKMIILLNIDQLLNIDELPNLAGLKEQLANLK